MKTIDIVCEAIGRHYPTGTVFSVYDVRSRIEERYGPCLSLARIYRSLKTLRKNSDVKVVGRNKRGLLYMQTNWLDWWRGLFE